MQAKLIFQKSCAFLLLTISFPLSLLISPNLAGGFILKWHSGVLINFILAVIYLIILGREIRFRGWSTMGRALTLGGTFIGVFSIANVILVNPFENFGLLLPFILELMILINFRSLFMPFHLKGRQLILNILMVILFGLIFKLLVLTADIPWLSNVMGIDPAFKGHLNLPLMSAVWLSSLGFAFLGLYLMGSSVKNSNEIHLEQFKTQLGIEPKHLMVLGIKNHDLLGMNKQEIEDYFHDRIRMIKGESRRFNELASFADQIPNIENSWAAPMIFESKKNDRY